MPLISVIVVNWNGSQLLTTCLGALQRQRFTDYEVLLVDNGSTDDSVEKALTIFPAVKILALEKNFGFCGGNNRGIAQAQGRYIVLLNNDAEAHPDFLGALYEAVEAHPEVGSCATRMLNFGERSRIDNCGIGIQIFGNGYPIGSGKLNTPQFDREYYVFGACGGAVLYRRSMLETIGVFDEDYFSHIEDTDLAWRAQLAGYRCLYVPRAIVYHMGGATSIHVRSEVLYRIQRNKTWTYLKNMPGALLIGLLPAHILYGLYWVARSAFRGQGGVVWQAKVDVLKGWTKLMAKRRVIQGKRQLSTWQMFRLLNWYRV